jgi:hypothetical protein
VAQTGKAGLGVSARPARSPDRRLGARPRDGRTLLPRHVRADPERRAHPRSGGGRLAGRPHRLCRPPGASEGPAGPSLRAWPRSGSGRGRGFGRRR